MAFVLLAIGFWVLQLQRPYGVLIDDAATRRAAEVAVAANGVDDSFVVGWPPGCHGWRWLVGTGLPADDVIALPTLLPLIVPLAVACAILLLWRRVQAALAVVLWLAFATGELEVARGSGLVPLIWSRPGAACAFVGGVGLVLAATAASRRHTGAVRLGSLGILLAVCAGAAAPESRPMAPLDGLLAATLDQMPWIAIGAWGALRRRDEASRLFVFGGGGLAIAASLGAPVDDWVARCFLRVGLLLGSSLAIWEVAPKLGRVVQGLPRVQRYGFEPRNLGVAALLFVTLPGSFLVWWNPVGLDPVAEASLEPFPQSLETAMSFIRRETPADAVFLASPSYAPQLVVRTGRRVLRADGLADPLDRDRRISAERPLLARRPLPARAAALGVDYVFAAPGDFKARRVESPEELAGYPGLERIYVDGFRFHVFRIVGGDPPPS